MEDDVQDLRIKFTISDEVELWVPNSGEIADNPFERWFAVYEILFDLDMWFPLPGLASAILAHYWIVVGQLMPNSWRVILRVVEVGIEPSEVDFQALYLWSRTSILGADSSSWPVLGFLWCLAMLEVPIMNGVTTLWWSVGRSMSLVVHGRLQQNVVILVSHESLSHITLGPAILDMK